MTKAKKRFIAYVFFTIAFVFVVISFIISQQEYSKNNWYVTLYQGDKPKIYIFYPNIPYTINSDDYIRRYAFMTKDKVEKAIIRREMDGVNLIIHHERNLL